MTTWKNVVICNQCWELEEGDRVPVRLRDPGPPQPCYACDRLTDSGIFVRRRSD
jgi:hypothetical protein